MLPGNTANLLAAALLRKFGGCLLLAFALGCFAVAIWIGVFG